MQSKPELYAPEILCEQRYLESTPTNQKSGVQLSSKFSLIYPKPSSNRMTQNYKINWPIDNNLSTYL